jgi:hypothetical protein
MTDHRAAWVAALAKLTTPHDPERAAAAMAAFLPFLADLPVQAFTLDSMRHVAMQDRRMMIPDLREVLEPLTAHWRANRPHPIAIAAPVAKPEPERAPPTDEERAAVSAKVREAMAALSARPVASVRTADEQIAALGGAEPRPAVRSHHAPVSVLAEAREALARKAGGA